MLFQYLQPLLCWNKMLKRLRRSYRQQVNFQCVLRPVSSPNACGFNWICQDQPHTLFPPQLHSRSQLIVGASGNWNCIALVIHNCLMGKNGQFSFSCVMVPQSTENAMELWVKHCVWLVLTDPIETTSIWTNFDYVNELTISGKYTSFLRIKNNHGRTKGENFFSTFLQPNRLDEGIPQSIQEQSITI